MGNYFNESPYFQHTKVFSLLYTVEILTKYKPLNDINNKPKKILRDFFKYLRTFP